MACFTCGQSSVATALGRSFFEEPFSTALPSVAPSSVTPSSVFARWTVDTVNGEEKKYMTFAQPVCRSALQRSAKVVSLHHLFTVNYDGDTGKLKLLSWVDPHGNKEQFIDKLGSDSSKAQFPVIRIVLSVDVIHKLELVTLDISKLTSKQMTCNAIYICHPLPVGIHPVEKTGSCCVRRRRVRPTLAELAGDKDELRRFHAGNLEALSIQAAYRERNPGLQLSSYDAAREWTY